MVQTMNADPIIFAMANPDPEIMPHEAKEAGAHVIGTGRSDFPNQINNVLAFPGIFRGALDVNATHINEEMKKAAVYAIADLIADNDLSEDYVIPNPFDGRVAPAVAAAVAKTAMETGVARKEVIRRKWLKKHAAFLLSIKINLKFIPIYNRLRDKIREMFTERKRSLTHIGRFLSVYL